ncbi:uncharacterized protein LOC124841483, partial [Vigna umbellata]|uniref:uncharacterized protein LOC124841483 n=1 Tax=Vigna umbellata TaxID=87088 RepID=UPI001F5F8A86
EPFLLLRLKNPFVLLGKGAIPLSCLGYSTRLLPPSPKALFFLECAIDLWNNLRERFSQGDLLRIAALQEEIYGLSQGTRSVSKFYTALKTLWEELDNYRPFSSCSCFAKTYHQQDFIIRFLKGLDERFSIVRSQILLMDPLPAINCVFSMVVQQERQLTTSLPTEPNAFVNAVNHSFSGKGRGSGPSSTVKGASNKKCSYCHRPGHTIDVCWGKHGYPPGHPRYPGGPKFNRDASRSSSINSAAVIEPTEGGNILETEGGPITLTHAQYKP